MNQFLVFIFLLAHLVCLGQKHSYITTCDTLTTFTDKAFVNYKVYTDSTLTDSGQAFLYPDTIEIRRSRLLPSWFTITIPVDSVVLHGTNRRSWSDGKYFIAEYDNGIKTSITYYDSLNNEITHHDFYENIIVQYDPERGYGIYFFKDHKKKK